jgi:hypothetical protein
MPKFFGAIFRVGAALAGLGPALCFAQPANTPTALTITPEAYATYPSMEPVTVIEVQLSGTDVIDALQQAGWNCGQAASVSSYKVSAISSPGSTRDVSVAFVDTGLTCKTAVFSPGSVKLHLRAEISKSDQVQVTLQNLKKGVQVQSMKTAAPSNATPVAFTATPQAAPGEKLLNGKTRDTGQLSVSFTDSNLAGASPVDLYLKSTDLFSTDERDSKSAFSGTFGAQHGLSSSLYSPVHIEAGMQGNQIASNLSGVVAGGITTLAPWSWSKEALNNAGIQVPLPPDFTMNAQYTHRFRQDPSTKKPLATDDFSLNPSITWSSISLPWMCGVLKWLNKNAKTDPKTQYSGCLGIEGDAGLWYLPLDLTSKGSQRVEGYGDVSILIPLSNLKFIAGILPYVSSNDPMKSRIRVNYSDAVNAANNYVRTRTWTYGIELIK